jgi:SAM-dependent methyltransferase
MISEPERKRLRSTFNRAADRYQRARPDYPDELLDHLIDVTGVRAGDRLLEVGCATGKATLPLAQRGFRITCIELGPALAEAARANLSDFGEVEIVEGSFEEWARPMGAQFDLVFAATAWQWVDPAVRYQKAWEALRAGGHLAFWHAVHVFPDNGDPFFAEIQDVYKEIGEGLPAGSAFPRPNELLDQRAEIEASGLFTVLDIRHFDWERVYDADGYIELLDTFSGHIAMEPWQREHLYGAIRVRLAQRSDGRVRRHWGAVLHIAKRLEERTRPR